MRILMVCLGNICRSPMAEGIMRDLAERNSFAIALDSAGTSNYHIGEAPDPRAIANMKSNGHDISDLRARQFIKEDFDHFDHIFAMDHSNMRDVLRLARDEQDRAKVQLFLASPGVQSKIKEVPDPYYEGERSFELVYQLLKKSTEGWLQMWQKDAEG